MSRDVPVRHEKTPWGYSDFFFAYVGSGYFFGFKILNFNIVLGFQKHDFLFGYEDFVDIFYGVSTKFAYI